MTSFHVILLAGGTGTRMGKEIPKQYVTIKNKPLALYSFEIFSIMPEIDQLIIVCHPSYQHLFQSSRKVQFAEPGHRRQDSVFNGLQAIQKDGLICIHDAARPFITAPLIRKVVKEADEYGAAVLGVPVKGTIKICDYQPFIQSTPDRSTLWEMQTPQVMQCKLLQKGFEEAQKRQLTVTDDVSLVELTGHPVKVVESSYTNFKVTTPDDLLLMDYLLDQSACTPIN